MKLHLNRLDQPEGNYVPQLLTVENQRFEGKMVPIDNHHYVSCHFVNCNLVYSGGPFAFYECDFQYGTLAPTGPAQRAIELHLFFQENAEAVNWPG
jgi:hypothetical protein